MARGGVGVAGHIFKRPKPDPSWQTYRASAGRYRGAFPARSAAHAARQLVKQTAGKLDGESIIVETPTGNRVEFAAED
jgi:hypothetical protein